MLSNIRIHKYCSITHLLIQVVNFPTTKTYEFFYIYFYAISLKGSNEYTYRRNMLWVYTMVWELQNNLVVGHMDHIYRCISKDRNYTSLAIGYTIWLYRGLTDAKLFTNINILTLYLFLRVQCFFFWVNRHRMTSLYIDIYANYQYTAASSVLIFCFCALYI